MMQPTIPRDKAAARYVLGDLIESPYVKPFVHDDLDGGWIDFERMHGPSIDNLSTGEQMMVAVARSLYNRGHVDLGELAATVDEACWRRVFGGMTILRGLEEGLNILPGDWVDGDPL